MPLPDQAPMTIRRAWRCWLLLALLLAGIYLVAWPLIWRVAVLPSLDQERQGLRVAVLAGEEGEGGQLRSFLAPGAAFDLPEAPAAAWARGIWLAPGQGASGLALEADDYAELYLDRRPLILQPPKITDLNRRESLAAIAPGPHFLEVRLHNPAGRGWCRLLTRVPGEGSWQPLDPPGLHPVDLGNLPFWLGLADWLEGLALWGLAGALLALPLPWLWAGPARRGLASRLLKGLAGLVLGLPLVMALARALPADALPFLTAPYGADPRLPALGLLAYALALGLGVWLTMEGWRSRLIWWGLLMGLVITRIMVWPYSMHCGIHADYTSFEGFHYKFSHLLYQMDLERGFTPQALAAYPWGMLHNLDVGYPAGCFSFPALLLGLGGLAAQLALLGTGASQDFSRVGHLLGPACNLAYVLMLAWTARRLFWGPVERGWSWLLVLLLWMVPTHLYLGGNITYNLLADALHLGFLLAALAFMGAWRQILETPTAPDQGHPRPGTWPWRRGALLALLLGLCLATKLVFIPALLTLLLYAGALMARHGRTRPGLALGALPLTLLACLLAGGLLYGLILLPSLLGVPGFWGQLIHMTGDNTGLSLRYLSPWACLEQLFGGILIPNLGYPATLAGGLGLLLWGWRAAASRDLERIMALAWALMAVGINLLSGQMLLAFNAMPRSSLLLGLWLVLALHLARALWARLAAGRSQGTRRLLAGGLALTLGLEIFLTGLGLLALYRDGAPRWRAEQYLRTHALPPKQVAYFNYLGFPDDPNTALGRVVQGLPRDQAKGLLATDQGCQRLIRETGADFWLIASQDLKLFRGGRDDWRRFGQALAQGGYGLAARLESRPMAGRPRLEALWRRLVLPLLSDADHGGLLEPAWVEVYERESSSPAR